MNFNDLIFLFSSPPLEYLLNCSGFRFMEICGIVLLVFLRAFYHKLYWSDGASTVFAYGNFIFLIESGNTCLFYERLPSKYNNLFCI